jgi:hypothetical protein
MGTVDLDPVMQVLFEGMDALVDEVVKTYAAQRGFKYPSELPGGRVKMWFKFDNGDYFDNESILHGHVPEDADPEWRAKHEKTHRAFTRSVLKALAARSG